MYHSGVTLQHVSKSEQLCGFVAIDGARVLEKSMARARVAVAAHACSLCLRSPPRTAALLASCQRPTFFHILRPIRVATILNYLVLLSPWLNSGVRCICTLVLSPTLVNSVPMALGKVGVFQCRQVGNSAAYVLCFRYQRNDSGAVHDCSRRHCRSPADA